ncbi:hypothetical protein ANN_21688 [Periplaneta americana]|uniref:Reverse transcriptase domain-containing protein n=1 Tax=Periplaneta americana TaxID=6978 RepID=A0ABQ8S657_PERAM|nr:hypothetical protein ANN_21688 [Periplaneta americana]
MSRLYSRIMTTLISGNYDPYQTEEQSGYRSGRSTVDNIFCLTQLIEKRTQISQETHVVFVDLAKAYDTIPLIKLFQVLDESQINPSTIRVIKELYHNAQSRIKQGSDLSENFKVNKGL